jgi:Sec7-like guanine-nucleotide exchange factor
LFVSAYVLVLMGLIATFFLMQMAMKGGGGDDFQNRNKLLSLELLQNCLESVNYAFTFNFRFFDLIRAYICYILLKASVSSALPVFQLAVNVYMILLQRFRETLKVIVAAWVLSNSTTA